MKKVAVVTDDGKTISPHFGRARYFLVYELDGEGKIASKETRPKPSHNHHQEAIEVRRSSNFGADPAGEDGRHEEGAASDALLHDTMLSGVRDCEALIGRGMGAGMFGSIRELGIKPFVTSIAAADDAVQAYIKGTLDNHVERLH
jgi:predicted Fe-Mo cluster-binding NifX family protein